MESMLRSTNGETMSNESSSVVSGLRALLERLFESLERAKLKDLERSIARAANEREVSQRVHRLEAGDTPFA
jgi:molybdopterin converting factor small subunit